METTFLTPVLALVTWTLIAWFIMYSRRIPAMNAAKLDPQEAAHPGSLNVLPSKARAAADNYNHLHEQPTVFYALIFYSHLAGVADEINLGLAWTYVGLRVLHSLIQITANKVPLRFLVFALSTFVLVAIAVRNILALF
ncbi:MAPEG family protein [Tepidicaulis sp. LMO-SS28]|uniref:MAPEG family protein n=1 Tax=Tepidicaulis sp. LMO-SS28 TaxID=3447455 RepID=UPI003EE34DEF